jgi:hypothetical protein
MIHDATFPAGAKRARAHSRACGGLGGASAGALLLLSLPMLASGAEPPRAFATPPPTIQLRPLPLPDPNHCRCDVLGPRGGPIQSDGLPEFDARGGSATLGVRLASDCQWTAASQVGWSKVVSGPGGQGPGTVTLAVEAQANTSSRRSGTVTVCNQQVPLAQRGFPCAVSYAFDPRTPAGSGPSKVPGNGGGGSIALLPSPPDCRLLLGNVQAVPVWLSATRGQPLPDKALVSYTAAANSTGVSRAATLTINYQVMPAGAQLSPATQAFTIVQDP